MSHRQGQKEAARQARLAAERAEQARATRQRRVIRLGGLLAAAVVAVVAVVLVAGGGKDGGTASKVTGVADGRAMLAGIPQKGTMLGKPDAPFVLTEYADLQCPFCRDYALHVLPTVIDRYVRTGKLRLELRTLRFIGPDSDRGARAALEAGTQGKLWNFVDLWYRNQGHEGSGYADDDFVSGIAKGAGAAPSSALEAIDGGAHESAIADAETQAQTLGIESTPSFVIGKQPGRGRLVTVKQLDPDAFIKAIAPELEG